MSTVTDVILTTGLYVCKVADLNAHIKAVADDQEFWKVEQPAGMGGKALQADVFIGAFNYLDLSDFVSALREFPFGDAYDRQIVRLFVQQEHDEHGFHEVAIWPEATVIDLEHPMERGGHR